MTDVFIAFMLALSALSLGYFWRELTGQQWCKSHCLPATKLDLQKMETRIMATQAELAAELAVVKTHVEKIGTETRTLLDKVQELTDALENAGSTTPEVDAALAALKAQVQVVDDLVPDAPPMPPA